MKKTLLYLVALCTLSFAVVSCEKAEGFDQEEQDFIEYSTANGAYSESYDIFTYNQEKHQQSLREGASFGFQYKLQSDTQGIYIIIKADATPTAVNQDLNVKITGKAIVGVDNQTVKMEVAKITADQAWLWSSSKKLGFIVPLSL